MVTTMVLLASVAGQGDPRPTQVHPAAPVAQWSQGTVTLDIVSASVTIKGESANYELMASYHNGGDQKATGQVALPFYSYGLSPRPSGALSASWNKIALPEVKPAGAFGAMRGPMERPGSGANLVAYSVWPVEIPARGTGTLRANFAVPLAKTGLDYDTRLLSFLIGNTVPPIGQFQFSIKWDEAAIFKVRSATFGDTAMQVGNNGAFVKMSGPLAGRLLQFKFYPMAK